MGILFNVLAVFFIGWPSMVVGYIATAIKAGYLTGAHFYNAHESAAIDKFCKKEITE